MRKIQNLAFSLIELLVVISVIGILAMFALASYTGAQKQTRDTQRKNDLSQYQAALESYSAKHNTLYPIYSGDITEICEEIGIADSCPSDPNSEMYYNYQSDGVAYSLSAELETKSINWVVSSDGTATEVAGSSPTPGAGGTSTPVSTTTTVPTSTSAPVPTATTTPVPTATDSACYDPDDPGCLGEQL